ncbi:hypothetical protein [Candidatus Corynebacterium faecigallinarum]|uniref:hypothetical protein n=1 Tax=Candidatus Corynebacterium faecigallinarum TaxID=2838528 RepID=UPI003FD44B83
MSGYDLYQSLGLSRAHPPEQLATELDRQISDLRAQGVQDSDPRLDEVLIARSVLGDAGRRTEYDRALDAAPGTAAEADVPWIKALAQRSAGWDMAGGNSAGNGAGNGAGSGGANVLAAIDRFLTPLPLAAVSGLLTVLAFITFFFNWGKVTMTDGPATLTFTITGFGSASMDMSGFGNLFLSDTRPGYTLLSLVILILLVVGTVLLGLTRDTRFGALLVAVAGGLLTLYGVWALFTKLGADDLFGGEEDFGSLPSPSVGAGAVLGLIVGVLTLAVGVLVVLRLQGSLLPQAWTSGKAASGSAAPVPQDAASDTQDAPSDSSDPSDPSDGDNPNTQRPNAEQ